MAIARTDTYGPEEMEMPRQSGQLYGAQTAAAPSEQHLDTLYQEYSNSNQELRGLLTELEHLRDRLVGSHSRMDQAAQPEPGPNYAGMLMEFYAMNRMFSRTIYEIRQVMDDLNKV